MPMNIQISLTDNISPDTIVLHYQLCQLSLQNIIGFISESQWNETLHHLNQEQKQEIEQLWIPIKTKNRKKPSFYTFKNQEINNDIFITKLQPVKIENNGLYCASLVAQAHECYAISENPALQQIENINSISKILKAQKKNKASSKSNTSIQKQKNKSPENTTEAITVNGKSKGGYAALKNSMLAKTQNKTDTQISNKNNIPEEFNIWQQGIEKMMLHGKNNQSARGFIAKHIKLFNENIVKNALIALPTPDEKEIMDIYGYLLQIMREEEQKQDKSQKARNRRAGLVL